jgi:hypothetical protein
MLKQLDTPSPYYEGFHINIKGKIINFYYFWNNQKVTKIFLFIFFVLMVLKKRKDQKYARYIFWLEMYESKKKIEKPKKNLKIHTETIYCFAILA